MLPRYERLGLAIQPWQVGVVNATGLFRPAIVSGEAVPCELASLSDWGALERALSQVLMHGSSKRAPVRITLSQAWCRMALLSPAMQLRNQSELLRYAKIRLDETYGRLPDGWSVFVSDLRPDGGRVACAIPQALLDLVRKTVAANGLSLGGIYPVLSAVYNVKREGLKKGRVWLVTVEDKYCAIMKLHAGALENIVVRRIFADPLSELEALLKEEAVFGLSPGFPDRTAVFAPGIEGLGASAFELTTVEPAGNHAMSADLQHRYGMAIAGLLQ